MGRLLAFAFLVCGLAFSQDPAYNSVTAQRLREPADSEWLLGRRTYDGWGYSPLNQITAANVARLKVAWSLPTGAHDAHEAAILVNSGILFVSTPQAQVLAVDARTGKQLWSYRRRMSEDAFQGHPASRGVALFADKVYFAAGDTTLIALDARTGKEIWTTRVADNRSGYYMTLAPLIAGGKVMVGASGGEFGIRGFVAAFNPETGKELWRTYTIPEPGQTGSETWPKGNQWKTGGASVWITGTYDVETNLAYWGTGNGGPWMGDQRPGDNLYVASTVALDVNTGAIKGHYQYIPNESWDWDEVSPPLLIDYRRDGRTIRGLVDVARNGYLWFLDRAGGPIRFVDASPYVMHNAILSLDPKTGRPSIDPLHKPVTGKRIDACPSSWGGKNWPSVAFSPATRMIYIPANNNLCATWFGEQIQYLPGRPFAGASVSLYVPPGATHVGEVQAWNVDTGKRVWTHEYSNSATWGPILATAGGLVFSGGTADGAFHAFDAARGALLWQYASPSGILGQPVSYSLDGKQYIAVLAGWGGDARLLQGFVAQHFGGPRQTSDAGAILVFALDK